MKSSASTSEPWIESKIKELDIHKNKTYKFYAPADGRCGYWATAFTFAARLVCGELENIENFSLNHFINYINSIYRDEEFIREYSTFVIEEIKSVEDLKMLILDNQGIITSETSERSRIPRYIELLGFAIRSYIDTHIYVLEAKNEEPERIKIIDGGITRKKDNFRRCKEIHFGAEAGRIDTWMTSDEINNFIKILSHFGKKGAESPKVYSIYEKIENSETLSTLLGNIRSNACKETIQKAYEEIIMENDKKSYDKAKNILSDATITVQRLNSDQDSKGIIILNETDADMSTTQGGGADYAHFNVIITDNKAKEIKSKGLETKVKLDMECATRLAELHKDTKAQQIDKIKTKRKKIKRLKTSIIFIVTISTLYYLSISQALTIVALTLILFNSYTNFYPDIGKYYTKRKNEPKKQLEKDLELDSKSILENIKREKPYILHPCGGAEECKYGEDDKTQDITTQNQVQAEREQSTKLTFENKEKSKMKISKVTLKPESSENTKPSSGTIKERNKKKEIKKQKGEVSEEIVEKTSNMSK